MKTKVIIGLICLTAIGSIVFQALFAGSEPSQSIDVHFLNYWANVPLREVTDVKVDNTTLPVKAVAYDDLNTLLGAADQTDTALIIIDALTFLEYHDIFTDYAIYALRPKASYLMVDPKHTSIEHVNDIKGAVLGINGKASDEYVFRTVIDMEGIIGLSLDEIACTNLYDQINLLTDSMINYAVLEAPYDQYVLSRGARKLYTFDHMFDAVLVPKSLDDHQLEQVTSYLNEAVAVSQDDKTEKWLDAYFPTLRDYLSTDYMPFESFERPDPEVINQMITYFYATNRIDTKYALNEIVIEGFK
ncbi:hypothetical protein KHM83_12130 [Fusibacter paucivorans]|uniref:SsuA/THI5-like domain-containing protein n=1 Tax=Fusibacter paucivorans TaxID=76009 RepID=A0ABS5PQI4_9FIRM|nr:hypothetical protein [Fusibacter paucivorans]MBS7527423.1 hypothetical protein [Fusibacter paucivorans]